MRLKNWKEYVSGFLILIIEKSEIKNKRKRGEREIGTQEKNPE